MPQLQYRNENQNFNSNFVFQYIKKAKWNLGTRISQSPYEMYVGKALPVS